MATAPAGSALLSALAFRVWDRYHLDRRFARFAVRDGPES